MYGTVDPGPALEFEAVLLCPVGTAVALVKYELNAVRACPSTLL